ncbi:hypothetical protein [Aerosakkonema sp. BLCC-F183]
MRSIAHHLCTIGDRFYSVRCAAILPAQEELRESLAFTPHSAIH